MRNMAFSPSIIKKTHLIYGTPNGPIADGMGLPLLSPEYVFEQAAESVSWSDCIEFLSRHDRIAIMGQLETIDEAQQTGPKRI